MLSRHSKTPDILVSPALPCYLFIPDESACLAQDRGLSTCPSSLTGQFSRRPRAHPADQGENTALASCRQLTGPSSRSQRLRVTHTRQRDGIMTTTLSEDDLIKAIAGCPSLSPRSQQPVVPSLSSPARPLSDEAAFSVERRRFTRLSSHMPKDPVGISVTSAW